MLLHHYRRNFLKLVIIYTVQMMSQNHIAELERKLSRCIERLSEIGKQSSLERLLPAFYFTVSLILHRSTLLMSTYRRSRTIPRLRNTMISLLLSSLATGKLSRKLQKSSKRATSGIFSGG